MRLVGGRVGLGEPRVGLQAGLQAGVDVPKGPEPLTAPGMQLDLTDHEPPDVAASGERHPPGRSQGIGPLSVAKGKVEEDRSHHRDRHGGGHGPDRPRRPAGEPGQRRREQAEPDEDAEAGLGPRRHEEHKGDHHHQAPEPARPSAPEREGVGPARQARQQHDGAERVLVGVDRRQAQVGHRARRRRDPGGQVDADHQGAGPGEHGVQPARPAQGQAERQANDQIDRIEEQASFGRRSVERPRDGQGEPAVKQQNRPERAASPWQGGALEPQDGAAQGEQPKPDIAVDGR